MLKLFLLYFCTIFELKASAISFLSESMRPSSTMLSGIVLAVVFLLSSLFIVDNVLRV